MKSSVRSTTSEATNPSASLYEAMSSSSIRRSFANLNYLFISCENNAKLSSGQDNRSGRIFIGLRDVPETSSFAKILKDVGKKLNIEADKYYHLYFNQKCLTHPNPLLTLQHFRREQKLSNTQTIISFHLQRKRAPNSSPFSAVVLQNDDRSTETLFEAFLVFIHLSMANIIFNKAFEERWQRFLLWCDKDKSGRLERKEVDIALLIIFKLMITDEHHQPIYTFHKSSMKQVSFSAYDLLPVWDLPIQSWDLNQFQTLLLDTLIEHVKYNLLIDSPITTADQMKFLFDGIVVKYLEPIERTIASKMFIPKPQEWISFSWRSVIYYILVFLSAMIFLPITVSIILWKQLELDENEKGNDRLRSLLIKFIMIIFAVIFSLASYFPYYCLFIYYGSIEEMKMWNIFVLEVYWPLALQIYFMLLLALFFYHESVSSKGKERQVLVERCYEDAYFTFYEKNAIWINPTAKIIPSPKQTCSSKLFAWATPGFVIVIIVIIIRQLIPRIIRHWTPRTEMNNSTMINSTGKPSSVEDIQWFYETVGLAYSFLFFVMIVMALRHYFTLYVRVTDIMGSVTNNLQFIEHNSQSYYNLRHPINLDYFLARLKKAVTDADTRGYFIYTLVYALLIDAVYIIIELRQLFFFAVSFDNLAILFIVDIVILSGSVLTFLIMVAQINQKTTTDARQLIKRTITETTAKLIDIRLLPTKSEEDTTEQNSLENSIEYLFAMSEYIQDAKKTYSIKLFRFIVIDMSLFGKVALSLLLGVLSAVFTFLKGKSIFA